MELWRQAAKDPDTEPTKWLATGAPAGILTAVEDRGIFPLYDPAVDIAEIEPCDLHTEEGFTNYPGVDQDDHVAAEFERQVQAGFTIRVDSWEEAKAYLGADPVLSKIAAIKKLRGGKLKVRVIVDSKRS